MKAGRGRGCPTPTKLWFFTKKKAASYADRRTKSAGLLIEPYYCPCGNWHVRQHDKAEKTQDRLQREVQRQMGLQE